jgi:hypothetical protein
LGSSVLAGFFATGLATALAGAFAGSFSFGMVENLLVCGASRRLLDGERYLQYRKKDKDCGEKAENRG